MNSIHEFAAAKVNLTLKVGALGVDGYHGIESLVVFADVGDVLGFEPASTLSVTIDGPFGQGLGAEPDNLVIRAAKALKYAVGKKLGARITLYKNLPISSGIGGGSTDAAATLRGLNRLWGCGKSNHELETLGRALGADVPVCVQSRTRLMYGRGETLHDVSNWPPLDAVLVNPGFAVSTAQVFARFDDMGLGSILGATPVLPAENAAEAIRQLGNLTNDLTPAACKAAPEIADLLGELQRHPKTELARLCGSGATCLALASCAEDAVDLAADISAAFPHYWVQKVTLGGAADLS